MSIKNVYSPTLDGFRELVTEQVNMIPVVREFAADLETPVSVYLKLLDEGKPSFLLESVQFGEILGRYSFVGVNPRGVISLNGREVTDTRRQTAKTYTLEENEHILDIIKRELDRFQPAEVSGLPRLRGGAVGYLGYDVVRDFEKLPNTAAPGLDIPDAIFLLADTFVVFDHVRQKLLVIANARLNGSRNGPDVAQAYVTAIQEIERVAEKLLRPLPAVPNRQWGINVNGSRGKFLSNKTQADYEEMVRAAKEYIAAGDIFQVVLSQRFQRKTDAHPFAIYRALRMLNPSPYMFYFNFGELDFQVIGASPEMHVRLEDGTAHLRPIAGTRPRGTTDHEDAALATELLEDEKERAEHVMLVDLGRNDLGRVCDYGSVSVKDMMIIEKYSHVMHIVSHVEGKLNQDMDAFALMAATFPAGTLSGAPKVRAMEIIEELEGERRSLYGGAVGYFSYDGSSDTCIAIRTMVNQRGNVFVQAGAGIVADSDPHKEHQECFNKASALNTAIDRAEEGGF